MKPVQTAGAVDIPKDHDDDCALATSEIVLEQVDCACKPTAPASPAPPTTKPKPCSLSRASTPPPASDSPTGKWVWLDGAWYPDAGYTCKSGAWVFAPVVAPRDGTPAPLAPLRGAESTVDVCPDCAKGPIVAKDGVSIRLVPCGTHEAVARANAGHVESLTLGWAQSWELGDATAMPKIDDPKYVSAFGTFRSEAYIADMRSYHASLTPGGTVPASVKPDILAKVAIYALARQGKRFTDEAVATRELMSSAAPTELSALQSQLASIEQSRDHVDALLAKLKNPAPTEAGDVQTLATDIVAAAKTKGGLDQLFQQINAAQAGGPTIAPPLQPANPGVVPPSIPVSGAIDYDGPSFDDAFCVDDVADALGLPAARSVDDLDVLFDARQDVTDDDLVALGAHLASVDLGCASGTCGLQAE